MNCIFCKCDSSSSVSVEHIIPESLGNKEHVLPRGIVCDKCNNYFARKVEKPLLDFDFFIHARVKNFLANKKGRVPTINNTFLLSPKPIRLQLSRDKDGSRSIYLIDEDREAEFINYLQTHDSGTFVYPVAAPVDSYLFSRFLAKVGLEVLADKVMKVTGWRKGVIFNKQLDKLRHFARYGAINKNWPYQERRLYEENHRFFDETNENYEVLHEFNTLYTEQQELYAVVIILGIEYAINLDGPEIDGYEKWLAENNHRSPLYPDGPI